jgi:putative transposase
MKIYQSDLTDNQWQVIKEIVDDERKRKHNMRDIVNAILYVTKSGCQWRVLPKDFAP